MFTRSHAPALLAGLLLTTTVQAQELRLFEPIDSDAGEPAMNAPQEVFAAGNSQPAFTLRSTTRFGDQYQTVLVSRSGETVNVNWRAGESAPVPGMGGFAVVGVSAVGVSMQHPPGDACVNVEASGVRCQGADRAELRFAMSVPLASNGAAPVQVSEPQQQPGFFGNTAPMGTDPGIDAQAQQGPQVFINPFSGEPEVMPQISDAEQQARQQRQEQRSARLRQFEQQIPDEAIPPGMQRMRTPFGDRLTPIRQ